MYYRNEIVEMLGITEEDFRRVKRRLQMTSTEIKGGRALYSDKQIGEIIRHLKEYQPYLLKNYKKPIDPNKNENEIEILERELLDNYCEEKQRQLHLLRAKERKKYPTRYNSVSVDDRGIIK